MLYFNSNLGGTLHKKIMWDLIFFLVVMGGLLWQAEKNRRR